MQFIYKQNVAKKSGYRLTLIFLYKTVRNILYYLSIANIPRNKIHNLRIGIKQFRDQTKKAKIPISWNCTCHKYVVQFTELTSTSTELTSNVIFVSTIIFSNAENFIKKSTWRKWNEYYCVLIQKYFLWKRNFHILKI